MSDTTDAALSGLRERLRIRLERVRVRLREYELDATMIRGRTEEARDEEAALEEMLDGTPRRKPGRPRNVNVTVVNQPQADPDEGLPTLDDVRGILKETTA
jgi:hypothetical protein